MTKKGQTKKTDWGRGRWREMIVEQRKFMWFSDSVDKYAAWMGLKPGMTAVDIGCGLGYLGYTYWKYFGRRGRYLGVDNSRALLQDARRGASEWANGGQTDFIGGDVYHLPLKSKSADWVMCQTLLMHLAKPMTALKEMIRILKPGGLFMCNEPDNVSSSLVRNFFSIRELPVDESNLLRRLEILRHKGRIKLGRGDNSIGRRLPHMLTQLGMKDIGIRMNDKVWLLEPPYETAEQKHHFKMLAKNMSQDTRYWRKRIRGEYLAGGGSEEEFKEIQKITDRVRRNVRRQIKNKTLASCGGYFFYIIKARKPK